MGFRSTAYPRRHLSAAVMLMVTVLTLPLPTFSDIRLPSLGDASSYDISPHEERQLGQAWLRSFRAQVDIHYDPLVQAYSEQLVQRMATYNPHLDNKRLTVVIVDNRQLNAFAVPGNIMGLNAGLFAFAPNEDEFASVVGHELGHLSQHHFARQQEAAEQMQLPMLATMLAGIVAASQGQADAGVAAIASSQAAGIQNQLAYSRAYEKEADRVGLDTLVRAGYDPGAMPRMFALMQRQVMLNGGRAPEFLLTHPLTESRIADAEARADQMTPKAVDHGRDYPLIRARLIMHLESDPEQALARFLSAHTDPLAQQYAKALSDLRQQHPQAAIQRLKALQQAHPMRLIISETLAEAYASAEDWDHASQQLEALLDLSPDYYPAQFELAKVRLRQNRAEEAERLLQQLTQTRAQDPHIWYQLAETAGLAGDRVQVHRARAEFFQLTGRFKPALTQLDLALKQSDHYATKAAVRERRAELVEMRQQFHDLMR